MASRNPDRIPITMRRSQNETVEAMIRNRWEVISKCEACGLVMTANLMLIAKVKPGASLWNRKERCRRIGCTGWVHFQARAPGMSCHEQLSARDPDELHRSASPPPRPDLAEIGDFRLLNVVNGFPGPAAACIVHAGCMWEVGWNGAWVMRSIGSYAGNWRPPPVAPTLKGKGRL